MENALYHSRKWCFIRYAKGGTDKTINRTIIRHYENTTGIFCNNHKGSARQNFGIGGKTIDKVKAEYMQTHHKQ